VHGAHSQCQRCYALTIHDKSCQSSPKQKGGGMPIKLKPFLLVRDQTDASSENRPARQGSPTPANIEQKQHRQHHLKPVFSNQFIT